MENFDQCDKFSNFSYLFLLVVGIVILISIAFLINIFVLTRETRSNINFFKGGNKENNTINESELRITELMETSSVMTNNKNELNSIDNRKREKDIRFEMYLWRIQILNQNA